MFILHSLNLGEINGDAIGELCTMVLGCLPLNIYSMSLLYIKCYFCICILLIILKIYYIV